LITDEESYFEKAVESTYLLLLYLQSSVLFSLHIKTPYFYSC